MSLGAKVFFLLALLAILAVTLLNIRDMASSPDRRGTIPQLYDELQKRNVRNLLWKEEQLHAVLNDGTVLDIHAFEAKTPAGADLIQAVVTARTPLTIESPGPFSRVLAVLSMIAFPIIIVMLLYFFVLRPAQAGADQVLREQFRKMQEAERERTPS